MQLAYKYYIYWFGPRPLTPTNVYFYSNIQIFYDHHISLYLCIGPNPYPACWQDNQNNQNQNDDYLGLLAIEK